MVLSDTDHLWGIGGDVRWVWKSFMRGLHPIFMDPYLGCIGCVEQYPGLDPRWNPLRRAMGDTRRLAGKLDLAALRPSSQQDLCSTGFCLSAPGQTYVAFQPAAGPFTLQVDAAGYAVEWLKVATGEFIPMPPRRLEAGRQTFRAPFEGDAVLLLQRERSQ